MAVVIPYTRAATWADGSTTDTAAKRNTIEDGIFNAHQQPAVRVTHNAAQSITSGVTTTLAFNTERFDQAGGDSSTQHDTVTNNSRLTCRFAGIYLITVNIEWAANSTGARNLQIKLNATTVIADLQLPAAISPAATVMALSTLYSLAVNDFVEAQCNHNAGSAVNVNATSNYSPEFMMVRVA